MFREEGTSYQDVIDEMRCDLSQHYLRERELAHMDD